jgi:phosphoglycolate phosphatase-like HAD superfamily hydrolase
MASPAVILDVDGTLVDSNDAHARAWVDAFAAEGITVAFDRVRRAIGMGGDKLMPAVSGIEKDSPEGQRISDRRARIFKERELPGIRAFPGVHALAERLVDDGYVLSVASSAKDDELRPLLERAGVLHLIAANASSDDAEHSKPDPDIVVAALKAAGVDASRAIMIGDTPYDVAAAGRAGIQIIALECGGWRREELNGAIAVYADPAHLLSRYGSSPLAALASRTQTRA